MIANDETTADRALAVFDLDGTLVRGDTFLPFLVSYAWRHRRWRPLLTLPFWLLLYGCKILSASGAKQRVLIAFLRGQARAKVDRHAEWFCQSWVRPRLQESVLERLRAHQQAGDRVILLSASPDPYVHAIGEMLGIKEVLCTQVVKDGDNWDGTLLGENCKGEGKVRRVVEYLKEQSAPANSWAYGDSPSDLPLLGWVSHGAMVQRGQLMSVAGNPERDFGAANSAI